MDNFLISSRCYPNGKPLLWLLLHKMHDKIRKEFQNLIFSYYYVLKKYIYTYTYSQIHTHTHN